ncbi:hypothetical protein [Candidatus Magnetobacterium casense]|uniref:Uncharacterized protein n=1 Tax=Candidatus Magnetobacterium casense TaxID=1455061 RepID=A0ABS6S2E9_9BACT|nr:hypothetical protein [Candidatus Magnetobacterium casensis]MBV6342996.1 hypothetical protein [Candidatus Magnetobacterium casensis]
MLGYNPGLYQMQMQPPLEREYSFYEGMRSNFMNELMWAKTDGEIERIFDRWRLELQGLLTGGFINPMIYNLEHQNMEALRRTRLKAVREGKVSGLGALPALPWWGWVAIAVPAAAILFGIGLADVKNFFSGSRA